MKIVLYKRYIKLHKKNDKPKELNTTSGTALKSTVSMNKAINFFLVASSYESKTPGVILDNIIRQDSFDFRASTKMSYEDGANDPSKQFKIASNFFGVESVFRRSFAIGKNCVNIWS
jgi:hypothetical protein